MKNAIISFIGLFFANIHAYAYIDCERPIKRIWAGSDGNRIYVTHGDESGNSGMPLAVVESDEKVIDRALSILLSAKMSGNPVTFRYIDTNGTAATCTPTSTQYFIGVWLN